MEERPPPQEEAVDHGERSCGGGSARVAERRFGGGGVRSLVRWRCSFARFGCEVAVFVRKIREGR